MKIKAFSKSIEQRELNPVVGKLFYKLVDITKSLPENITKVNRVTESINPLRKELVEKIDERVK